MIPNVQPVSVTPAMVEAAQAAYRTAGASRNWADHQPDAESMHEILAAAMAAQERSAFRSDLPHRLRQASLGLVPLKTETGDLGLLAEAADGLDAAACSFGSTLAFVRSQGWSVAVHNDYRLHGIPYTFWLFTHSNGRWAKGEGKNDDVALEEAVRSILAGAGDTLEESVEALVMRADRVLQKYDADSDWTEWTDLRDAIKAVKDRSSPRTSSTPLPEASSSGSRPIEADLRQEMIDYVVRNGARMQKVIAEIGEIRANTQLDEEEGRLPAYRKGYHIGFRDALKDLAHFLGMPQPGEGEAVGLNYGRSLKHSDTLISHIADLLSFNPSSGLEETWNDAYKAFVGAFDTPVDRRKRNDEFSRDARTRLRKFDDIMQAVLSRGTGSSIQPEAIVLEISALEWKDPDDKGEYEISETRFGDYLRAKNFELVISPDGYRYKIDKDLAAGPDGKRIATAKAQYHHDRMVMSCFEILSGQSVSEIQRYVERCSELSENGRYVWWSRLADILSSTVTMATLQVKPERRFV